MELNENELEIECMVCHRIPWAQGRPEATFEDARRAGYIQVSWKRSSSSALKRWARWACPHCAGWFTAE